MKFASCRIVENGFLVNVYSKEYNKTVYEKTVNVDQAESSDFFKDIDYIDISVDSKEVLFFSRNYPPVKTSYIKKIIVQDIEVETPFKENDLVIDMRSFPGKSETSVFCAKKQGVRETLEMFDPTSKDKIRSLVPEEMLLFSSPDNLKKAIFIGADYCALVFENGQILKSGGTDDLKKELLTCFNSDDPEKDLASWMSVTINIASSSGLSDLDILIKKKTISFIEQILAYFTPFSGVPGETAIFLNIPLVPGFTEIISSMDSSSFSSNPFVVYTPSESLEMITASAETDSAITFTTGEFAYKGGFSFLKKRIYLALTLYFAALIMLIAGLQIRISNLDERILKGEERTKTLMKDVIGKEMPSLRQAISIMEKTIKGETTAADKKAVFPYSALYIMEIVFPYFTFENSTIEVSELSIKEEGKIRVTGTSASLEDINKFTELLENDPLVGDINRGQINTRNDKSSFNVSFSYANAKKDETKTKKGKKKGTSKEKEDEI